MLGLLGPRVSIDPVAELVRIPLPVFSLQSPTAPSAVAAPQLAPSNADVGLLAACVLLTWPDWAAGSGGQSACTSLCGLRVLASHLSAAISRLFPTAPASCASLFVLMV